MNCKSTSLYTPNVHIKSGILRDDKLMIIPNDNRQNSWLKSLDTTSLEPANQNLIKVFTCVLSFTVLLNQY